MNLHAILFSTPMVQANNRGAKTETRRLTGLKEINDNLNEDWIVNLNLPTNVWSLRSSLRTINVKPPYGEPGEIMWVRESHEFYKPRLGVSLERVDTEGAIRYAADKGIKEWHQPLDYNPRYNIKRPSIHLPILACRTFLKVTAIGLRRLHTITWDEAVAEGCPGYRPLQIEPTQQFQQLWIDINGYASWEINPFVWVYRYEITEAPALETLLSIYNKTNK